MLFIYLNLNLFVITKKEVEVGVVFLESCLILADPNPEEVVTDVGSHNPCNLLLLALSTPGSIPAMPQTSKSQNLIKTIFDLISSYFKNRLFK